ncbi:MAG: hypothetical protein QOI98_3650 [Solirubrobacteraceae bacterium]|jgi:hypothetical protein|nr:hypothetical protein [Solirubrobacteraceae bacterium]
MTPPEAAPQQKHAIAGPETSKAESRALASEVARPNSALAQLLINGERGAPEGWLIRAPDMSGWGITRLIDERDQLQEWLSRRTTSSPASSAIEAALVQVTEALARKSKALQQAPARVTKGAGKHAAKAGGTAAAASPELRIPRILRERSSVQYADPPEMRAELDLIAEWLQHADLSRADRQILRAELANLSPLLEQDRTQRAAIRRTKMIKQALTGGGEPRAAVLDQIRRIDGITPLPGEPGVQALMHGDEMIRLTDEEVAKLRTEIIAHLDKAAHQARCMNEATYSRALDWMKLNYEEHPVVHSTVSVLTGERAGEVWDDVWPDVQQSNTLIMNDYRRNDVSLAKRAEIVLLAVETADRARKRLNTAENVARAAASGIVTALEIIRGLAVAVFAVVATVYFAPLVAASLGTGAGGFGLTGAAHVLGTTGATAVGVGSATGIVTGTGAMLGVAVGGGSLDESVKAGNVESWRGFKTGASNAIGVYTGNAATGALEIGAANIGRLQKLWRAGLAGGFGNAAAEGSSAALAGESSGEVAKSTVMGFGSGFGVGVLFGGFGELVSGRGAPISQSTPSASTTGATRTLAGSEVEVLSKPIPPPLPPASSKAPIDLVYDPHTETWAMPQSPRGTLTTASGSPQAALTTVPRTPAGALTTAPAGVRTLPTAAGALPVSDPLPQIPATVRTQRSIGFQPPNAPAPVQVPTDVPPSLSPRIAGFGREIAPAAPRPSVPWETPAVTEMPPARVQPSSSRDAGLAGTPSPVATGQRRDLPATAMAGKPAPGKDPKAGVPETSAGVGGFKVNQAKSEKATAVVATPAKAAKPAVTPGAKQIGLKPEQKPSATPTQPSWEGRRHGRDVPAVQAGHRVSRHSGASETFGVEDADLNQLSNWMAETLGFVVKKDTIIVDGFIVDRPSALLWSSDHLREVTGLSRELVEKAPRHPGWVAPPGIADPKPVFMRAMLKVLQNNPKHPFRFLIDGV